MKLKNLFIKSSKLCVGCQLKINEGSHKYTTNEWNYRMCTSLQPTDAYGKLAFPGSHSKTASVRQSQIMLIVGKKLIFFFMISIYEYKTRRIPRTWSSICTVRRVGICSVLSWYWALRAVLKNSPYLTEWKRRSSGVSSRRPPRRVPGS